MFKRISLISLILICLINSSFADNQVREAKIILWTGAESRDFTEPANWQGGVVPGPNDNARFDGPAATTNGPVVSEGSHSLCYLSSANGQGRFTVNGGTINIHEYWGGDGYGHGILEVNGGVVNILNDNDQCPVMQIAMGSNGTVYMNGGIINCQGTLGVTSFFNSRQQICLGSGSLYLNGGTINAGDLFIASPPLNPNGSNVYITQGILKLDGDLKDSIDNYIGKGWITAYDGNGTVVVEYDSTQNVTIISGINSPSNRTITPELAPTAQDLHEIATRYLNNKQEKDAKAIYDRLMRDYPQSQYVEYARYVLADHPSEANVISALQKFAQDYPESVYAQQAQSKAEQLSIDRDYYDFDISMFRMKNLMKTGDIDAVRAIKDRLVADYSDNIYLSEATDWLKDGFDIFELVDSGDDANVMAGVDQLITDYSKQRSIPELLSIWIPGKYYSKYVDLKLAGFADDANVELEKAVTIWEKIVDQLPGVFAAGPAYHWLGDSYQRQSKYQQATTCYQKAIDEHSGYELTWLSMYMLGQNYMQMQKLGLMSEAEATANTKAVYEELLEKYPTCRKVDAARGWLNRTNSQ